MTWSDVAEAEELSQPEVTPHANISHLEVFFFFKCFQDKVVRLIFNLQKKKKRKKPSDLLHTHFGYKSNNK